MIIMSKLSASAFRMRWGAVLSNNFLKYTLGAQRRLMILRFFLLAPEKNYILILFSQ